MTVDDRKDRRPAVIGDYVYDSDLNSLVDPSGVVDQPYLAASDRVGDVAAEDSINDSELNSMQLIGMVDNAKLCSIHFIGPVEKARLDAFERAARGIQKSILPSMKRTREIDKSLLNANGARAGGRLIGQTRIEQTDLQTI